jgi:cell wall-associated NlpC family hydrolase/nucleoid-associated protein YgaU
MTGIDRDSIRRLGVGAHSKLRARTLVPVTAALVVGAGVISLSLFASAATPAPASGEVTAVEPTVAVVVEVSTTPEALIPTYAIAAAAPFATETATPAPILPDEHRASVSNRTGQRAEPTPIATPTPRPGIVKHVVAAGETLGGIAEKYGITSDTIVNANGIENAEKLAIGQELRIPPYSGTMYTVVDGDTLGELAASHGIIPEDIATANKLPNVDTLKAGQEIVIPLSPMQRPNDAAATGEKPAGKSTTPSEYKVVEGDTLSAIAGKFGISTNTLIWSNPVLGNGDKLQIGQSLTIPPVSGVLHKVTAGDTVTGVAARYDVAESAIVEANGLTEPYMLQLGKVLVIPGGAPPAPVVAQAAPAVAPAAPAPQRAAQPATARPAAPAAAPNPAPAAAPPASGAGPAAANIAMKYIGWAYVWGGTSPSSGGFDCSGLTYYAFRQAGRPIPRDLWGQVGSGARVARANLQVGDLLFFQNTYTSGLSHVGIYVGGGRFVHAGSEVTGILTSSLNDAYWSSRFYGATRP